MKAFDWSRPQRQPVQGLVVVMIQTLFSLLKTLWPLLILLLLRDKPDEGPRKFSYYEVTGVVVAVMTVLLSLLNFFFFRFYIEEDQLMVKSGWLKKQTKIIPLTKIQTVNVEQGFLHQILRIVKLTVDTAGSEKAELKIEALSKAMAEDLRTYLLQQSVTSSTEEKPLSQPPPLIELDDKDLLKLCLTANHLEAFFVLLFFGIGLLDNLRSIGKDAIDKVEGAVPRFSGFALLFLSFGLLLVTLIFSMGRVFFRYYNYRVTLLQRGLHIRSGLTNVKERMLPHRKIQYITWQRSWMRRLIHFWVLEYHTAGNDDAERNKNNDDIKVPVTREEFLPGLAATYSPMPDVTDQEPVRMHPSYVMRRLLMVGLLPVAVFMVAAYFLFDYLAWWLLVWTVLAGVYAWLAQRKFRLWALPHVAYIRKGHLGEEYTLVQWRKLQQVQISQSIFQKRRGLATLYLHTAAGSVRLSFISLQAAQQIADYALYKMEVDGTQM
jgi:putative membrane protein